MMQKLIFLFLPIICPSLVLANVYSDLIGNECRKLCSDVQSASLLVPEPLVTRVIHELTTRLRTWQPSSSTLSSSSSLQLPSLECESGTKCSRLSLSRVRVRSNRRAITVSMRLMATPVTRETT